MSAGMYLNISWHVSQYNIDVSWHVSDTLYLNIGFHGRNIDVGLYVSQYQMSAGIHCISISDSMAATCCIDWESWDSAPVWSSCNLTLNLGEYWRKKVSTWEVGEVLEMRLLFLVVISLSTWGNIGGRRSWKSFWNALFFFVNTNMLDRKGVYKCTGCLVRHLCIYFLLYHIVYWMAWQCTFLPLKWSPPKYEFEKYFKINYFEWGKGKGRKSSRFRGHMTVSFVL